MTVQAVKKSEDYVKALIAKNKLDTESAWSFTAADDNALLGADLDNWELYGLFYLGKDTSQKIETKAYYKHPYGKNGKVYMSALRAIRSRAGQQNATSIFNVAGRLLVLAKEKEENREMKIKDESVEYRQFQPIIDFRETDNGEWIFEGYIVTWDSIDDYNSTFKPGAFKKTIAERGDRIKVLWNHNTDEPIGKLIEIREDKKGVFVRAKLTEGVVRADDVYKNLKAKVIDTLSFGFTVLQSKMIEAIRHITEVKLYEISPVTFEANDTAIITNVRDTDGAKVKAEAENKRAKAAAEEKRDEDFKKSLENITMYAAGYQIMDALYETIYDIWWNNEDVDTVVAKLDAAISKFHSAYLQWASKYMAKFWEERKIGINGVLDEKRNDLAKAFASEIEDSLEIVSSRTSFKVEELKTLSEGRILPKESRNKLVELPEALRSAHQKERSKVVETLCDELRVGGFSDAERIRFSALLGFTEDRNLDSAEAISELLIKIREKIKVKE